MKIVIDIPEDMWVKIQDGYVPLGISKYLKNGTPLIDGADAVGYRRGYKEAQLAIPSAEPYEGMTNGQVHDMLYQMLVELKDGADRYGAEKWWNSPYEPQERGYKE